jgi:hypothetical protein
VCAELFVWASLLLAVAVLIGLALRLYFIAAWIFGSGDALDAHKSTGSFVWSLALPIIGTVQIFFVGDLQDPGDGWVHGLHGGLVLVVAALAWMIGRREADTLRLRARFI